MATEVMTMATITATTRVEDTTVTMEVAVAGAAMVVVEAVTAVVQRRLTRARRE